MNSKKKSAKTTTIIWRGFWRKYLNMNDVQSNKCVNYLSWLQGLKIYCLYSSNRSFECEKHDCLLKRGRRLLCKSEVHCLTTMFTSVFRMHRTKREREKKKKNHFTRQQYQFISLIKYGVTIFTWQHIWPKSNYDSNCSSTKTNKWISFFLTLDWQRQISLDTSIR